MPTAQAMDMAREANLDLVEVAATEGRPSARSWTSASSVHPKAESKGKDQDASAKAEGNPRAPQDGRPRRRHQDQPGRKFLEHKDKVLVYVLFKGRELQHIEEGKRILDLILEKLGDRCKVEKPPPMEGKRMSAMLAPK